MKHLLIAAALALAGCTTTTSVPLSPIELADRTAADEAIAVGAENSYKALRLALELGVDTGLIKGERAVQAAAADKRAYAALLVLRQAYRTANAADFLTAARSANSAVDQAVTVVKGR